MVFDVDVVGADDVDVDDDDDDDDNDDDVINGHSCTYAL